MLKIEQALVPTSTHPGEAEPDRVERGDQRGVAKVRLLKTKPAAPGLATPNPASVPLSDELVNKILKGRGLRGWLRAANIGRVLGLLSLYLFLDTYDVRANFGRRAADRKREEARARGRIAQFQEWSRELDRLLVDKFIRSLRFFIFHGADGSLKKGVRLAKQAS